MAVTWPLAPTEGMPGPASMAAISLAGLTTPPSAVLPQSCRVTGSEIRGLAFEEGGEGQTHGAADDRGVALGGQRVAGVALEGAEEVREARTSE